jgi:hypothetical protein
VAAESDSGCRSDESDGACAVRRDDGGARRADCAWRSDQSCFFSLGALGGLAVEFSRKLTLTPKAMPSGDGLATINLVNEPEHERGEEDAIVAKRFEAAPLEVADEDRDHTPSNEEGNDHPDPNLDAAD